MTYVFPDSLRQLRDFLRLKGFEGDSIKTSRQAAFVAQQLLGSRIKFPPQGQDMTPTLLPILRIPMMPDGDSEAKPDSYSNFIPDGVPI